MLYIKLNLDNSKNNGIPKSSILIGFSIINQPFWGTPIFGNTQFEFNTQIGWNQLPRWPFVTKMLQVGYHKPQHRSLVIQGTIPDRNQHLLASL